jgi:hypothetical protein
MAHPDNPAAIGLGTLIVHLQQGVPAWMDGDRVLPADGSALLAALEQAQEGLAGGDMSRERETPWARERETPGAAAQTGITAFVDQVKALIEAGLLEINNDHLLLERFSARWLAGEGSGERQANADGSLTGP